MCIKNIQKKWKDLPRVCRKSRFKKNLIFLPNRFNINKKKKQNYRLIFTIGLFLQCLRGIEKVEKTVLPLMVKKLVSYFSRFACRKNSWFIGCQLSVPLHLSNPAICWHLCRLTQKHYRFHFDYLSSFRVYSSKKFDRKPVHIRDRSQFLCTSPIRPSADICAI